MCVGGEGALLLLGKNSASLVLHLPPLYSILFIQVSHQVLRTGITAEEIRSLKLYFLLVILFKARCTFNIFKNFK